MKYIMIILVVASIVVLSNSPSHAGWLIYHKPEFKGRVLDAETKEPIEGAVVVVVYYKYVPGIGAGGATLPMKVKETLTDKNGDFHFPSYTTLIQPLSTEDRADFIIFKAGYGRPKYTPYGITPDNKEKFFSNGIGSTGELDLGSNFKMVKVTFGIVELSKLKTREERRMAMPSPVSEIEYKNQKLLIKMLNEENKNLGLKGQYKIEELTLPR